MGGIVLDPTAMSKKPIAFAVIAAIVLVLARVVERRTRPELADEYGS
ncbi:hypothetical protein [Halobaculum magnesiiphilum]|uniref:Uncharacterized protein n=1 Tax=Halobaculum magnesiiphilum TaxID=1017351 RepID=A0A8T8WIR5_9EURY|nr:hypothetical protein [Halobaculum magnesiiphilum]QZP39720.1 hypothetical protein K6T50_17225 [Halobaculum magnesiiphilum]